MSQTAYYNLKISSQGQVSVPAEVMRKLKLVKGGYIRVRLDNDSQVGLTNEMPIDKYLGGLPLGSAHKISEAIEQGRDQQGAKQRAINRAFSSK